MTAAAVGLTQQPGPLLPRVAPGGEQTNTITITVSGNVFDPATAEATAGNVVFDVTNQDGVQHTFTIDGTDVDIVLAPKRLRHRRSPARGRHLPVALQDPPVDDRHPDRDLHCGQPRRPSCKSPPHPQPRLSSSRRTTTAIYKPRWLGEWSGSAHHLDGDPGVP